MLLQNMKKEEFLAWKDSLQTKQFLQALSKYRDQLKEKLTYHVDDNCEGLALRTAKITGMCATLYEVANIDFNGYQNLLGIDNSGVETNE